MATLSYFARVFRRARDLLAFPKHEEEQKAFAGSEREKAAASPRREIPSRLSSRKSIQRGQPSPVREMYNRGTCMYPKGERPPGTPSSCGFIQYLLDQTIEYSLLGDTFGVQPGNAHRRGVTGKLRLYRVSLID